jgi:hypothetical protein
MGFANRLVLRFSYYSGAHKEQLALYRRSVVSAIEQYEQMADEAEQYQDPARRAEAETAFREVFPAAPEGFAADMADHYRETIARFRDELADVDRLAASRGWTLSEPEPAPTRLRLDLVKPDGRPVVSAIDAPAPQSVEPETSPRPTLDD